MNLLDKIDKMNFFAPDFGIIKSIAFIGFLLLVPVIVIIAMLACHYHQNKIEEYEKHIDEGEE